MNTCSWKRAFFSAYVAIVFCVVLTLETFAIKELTYWPYSLGILVGILIFLLPYLVRWLPLKDKALQRTLLLASIFWILASIAWVFEAGPLNITSELFAYLAYFVVYGGFFGIVEGVYKNPVIPLGIDKWNMEPESKIDYLTFEYEKWWKGLNMLWVVIIAIVVSGVINWTIRKTAPPLNYAFFLAFSSVPGIAMIVWYMIDKTNSIHRKIRDLYEKKYENELEE